LLKGILNMGQAPAHWIMHGPAKRDFINHALQDRHQIGDLDERESEDV
jgi:hypothetical protein